MSGQATGLLSVAQLMILVQAPALHDGRRQHLRLVPTMGDLFRCTDFTGSGLRPRAGLAVREQALAQGIHVQVGQLARIVGQVPGD